MASRKKGSFFSPGEAKIVVSELLEEYLRIYNKTGIVSTIIKIQIFLLIPFNLAPFGYSYDRECRLYLRVKIYCGLSRGTATVETELEMRGSLFCGWSE